MRSSFTLFRVRGIPIGINWSWLFVFAFFVWTLATDIFPRTYHNLPSTTYLVMAIVAIVLFFSSLLLHELGHAFRALREGMEIDGITLWLFGGVARFKGVFPSAGAEFRIAIAGPVVTAVLSAVFAASLTVFHRIGAPIPLIGVADYLARINLILLVFNMIPALPLDGGRVFRAYLWQRKGSYTAATMSATRVARAIAGVLIAFGVLGFVRGAGLGGLWFAFIGWFLLQVSGAEANFAQFRDALAGWTVSRLMTPDPQTVTPDVTIASFIDDVAHMRGHSTYPVVELGRLVGLMSLRLAAQVPFDRRGLTTVRDVMLPASGVPVVGPEDGVVDVVPKLQEGPGRAVVVRDGSVVGILSTSDIARALEIGRIVQAGPAPLESSPPSRRRPFVWILVVLVVLGGLGLVVHPPVAVLTPGKSFDIVGDITIKGVQTDRVHGRYLLTSVSLTQPNVYGFLLAVGRSDEMLPISQVIPRGVDPDKFFLQEKDLFRQTETLAAAAAARAAGLKVGLSGTGAIVERVVPGAPAAGVLKKDDLITAVDGVSVSIANDVGSVVRARPAGTAFTFTIKRGTANMHVEVRSRGGIVEDAPGIGVQLATSAMKADLPFTISFRDRDIGGPSAGLAYALAVYDLIEHSDLARGRSVAATGLIDVEGNVGAVGGLREKAAAAKAAGAKLFLVPDQEVRDASGIPLDVRGVSSLADAIKSLRS